jgi:hypothetical protein
MEAGGGGGGFGKTMLHFMHDIGANFLSADNSQRNCAEPVYCTVYMCFMLHLYICFYAAPGGVRLQEPVLRFCRPSRALSCTWSFLSTRAHAECGGLWFIQEFSLFFLLFRNSNGCFCCFSTCSKDRNKPKQKEFIAPKTTFRFKPIIISSFRKQPSSSLEKCQDPCSSFLQSQLHRSLLQSRDSLKIRLLQV